LPGVAQLLRVSWIGGEIAGLQRWRSTLKRLSCPEVDRTSRARQQIARTIFAPTSLRQHYCANIAKIVIAKIVQNVHTIALCNSEERARCGPELRNPFVTAT
jgi:hypothetical protein